MSSYFDLEINYRGMPQKDSYCLLCLIFQSFISHYIQSLYKQFILASMDEINMMLRNQLDLFREQIYKEILPIKEFIQSQQTKNNNFGDTDNELRADLLEIKQEISKVKDEVNLQLNNIKLQANHQSQVESQKIQILQLQLQDLQKELKSNQNLIDKINLSLSNLKKQIEIYQNMPLKQKIIKLEPQIYRGQHPQNPHNHRFNIKTEQNKISVTLKAEDGEYYSFFKNKEIPLTHISTFHIKQLKTQKKFIMTGIATKDIFGVKHVYNTKQVLLYDSCFGKVAENGNWKKGGRSIQDGQTIRIIVDTQTWWVSWLIGTVQLARLVIPAGMRNKELFLVVVMENKNDTVQIMLQ